MATDSWPTKILAVTSLHLDAKNPRLGRETTARAPREIIQYLFQHDKALEVAESIAIRGYFPNEPVLAIQEKGRYVVVEGNRRLAALKALRDPGLIEGSIGRHLARLSKRITDPLRITRVPVTIAPSRRATDRQIAGRHIGTPVLAWEAENRASFILDKLEEGYSNERLLDELGFSLSDIQGARQTRAIADMTRSLDLQDEVKAKLENPRAKIFSTLQRVFNSSVGREFLKVEPNPDHGLLIKTNKQDFVEALTKVVSDIAAGRQSSRTLNKIDEIRSYFESWKKEERPSSTRIGFVPSEIIKGKSVASPEKRPEAEKAPKKPKQLSKTVLPKDFKVRFGGDRLLEIRNELAKLDRKDFRNAGAVLLRVFFELAIVDYLKRTGKLPEITKKIESKAGKLPFGVPSLKQLVPEIKEIAKKHLTPHDANMVEKAIRYDHAAPFTISDLHSFVHTPDLPNERDIEQFWHRTEPLFRLMLETDLILLKK